MLEITQKFYNALKSLKNKTKAIGASLKWLHNVGKTLKEEMIVPDEKNNKNYVGKLVMFRYDPKLKDELPYWDMYPLGFVIEAYSDGFLMINMHYLPLDYRAQLMDALYNLINNDKMNETTKLNISYRILKNAAQYKNFKPCVKRYLFSHMRSKWTVIDVNWWPTVLVLPLQKFMKQGQTKVWEDSINIIKRK